jgi:hypothetical protein
MGPCQPSGTTFGSGFNVIYLDWVLLSPYNARNESAGENRET